MDIVEGLVMTEKVPDSACGLDEDELELTGGEVVRTGEGRRSVHSGKRGTISIHELEWEKVTCEVASTVPIDDLRDSLHPLEIYV